MRLILIALVTFFVFSAHAEKIQIFEAPYNGGYPTMTMEFKANKSLERAWTEIRVDTSDGDSDLGDDEYRQKVAGLRFDPVTNAIVLDRDGKITECAKWDNGSFFRISRWRPTGCRFSYKFGKKNIDDGFRIYKRNFVFVYLNIKE